MIPAENNTLFSIPFCESNTNKRGSVLCFISCIFSNPVLHLIIIIMTIELIDRSDNPLPFVHSTRA